MMITMENKVTSLDKTEIVYYTYGKGAGLVIIPGNNRMAHNYKKLCSYLEHDFTIHIIERRGRGKSGAQGEKYSIQSEVDDVKAVLKETGTTYVFGHSYGGLIALQAACSDVAIQKLAVYEPGVSIEGSFSGEWLSEFKKFVDQSKQVQAMSLFLKETELSPISNLPLPLLKIFSRVLLSGKSGKEMRDMMDKTPNELAEIIRLDSDGMRYKLIRSDTLLLGGSKTPPYLTSVLPILGKIIPKAKYKIIDDLDHNAPDLNSPKTIAKELKQFLN